MHTEDALTGKNDPFWSRISVADDGCWPWTAGTQSQGYGSTWDGSRTVLAHRLAWEKVNGPIAEGLCVLHRCDNPPCCNPAHLFLGTRDDNNKDKAAKGRGRNGLKPGAAPFPSGEGHPSAKFTSQQITEIRRRVSAGETLRSVASVFGVHNTTIRAIARRESYPESQP